MTTNGTKSVEMADLRVRVKVLQSVSASDKEINEVLIWLKKNVVATEALLRETKAGLAVGKLRTHPSKTVADLAKDLVKKWKAEVDRAKAKTPGAASTGSNGGTTAPSTTTSTNGSGSGTPQPRPSMIDTSVRGPSSVHSPLTPGLSTTTANGARSATTDGIPTNVLHESTRDRCLEMIYNALCIGSSISPAQLHKISLAVEKEVYTMSGSEVSPAYRQKIRSLYLNLKEKSNPRLRQAVASGEISPEKLCTMSSKEMASDERKEEDKKLTEANFHKALGSEELAAETDAFQCGRCKQRKTRYYQQQTRSADEPMTTFVTCTHCGHKWKFS